MLGVFTALLKARGQNNAIVHIKINTHFELGAGENNRLLEERRPMVWSGRHAKWQALELIGSAERLELKPASGFWRDSNVVKGGFHVDGSHEIVR